MNRFMVGEFSDWELSRGRITPKDFDMAVKSYTSWVYRAATLNANSVAQVPLHLYVKRKAQGEKSEQINRIPVNKKTYETYLRNRRIEYFITKDAEIEEIEEHPFIDLMRSVNPQRNEFDLKNETQLFLELTGNSYWYLVPSGLRGERGNIPAEIWVLPANRIKIIPDRQMYIKGYLFRQKGIGEPIFFSTDEVVHFRFPNPMDMLYGIGPLQGAANAVDVNQYMRDYEIGLLKNRARPDIVIKLPEGQTMTEKQRERFWSLWRQRYGGLRNVGKPGILEGGMDIKELTFSPRELNFLVGRKLTKNEICNIFGIPLAKVETESVNRANMETSEVMYQRDTISPRLRLLEQKINERILPIYGDNLFCAFGENVPQNRELMINEFTSYVDKGILTRNEVRQELGRAPIDGLDDILVPLNLAPIGSASEKQLKELSKKIAEKVKEKLYAN